MPTARDMAQLGANFLAAYQVRVAEIGTIRAEVEAHHRQTHRFIGELHRGSQAREAEAQVHHQETHHFMGGLHRESQARQAEVEADARQTHQFMGELRRGSQARRSSAEAQNHQTRHFMGGLHRESQARQAEVGADARQTHQFLRQARQFVRELHRGSQARKRVVVNQLAGYAAQMAGYALEVRGALAEWHRHQAALGAARRGATTPPRPKMATQRAPKAQPEEARPHIGSGADLDLAEHVMAFVAANPGTRLPAIEEKLGVSRIEVGRTIRELMDQGKVRRNDETREYFPR